MRKPEFVTGNDGKLILGLSQDSHGCFYYSYWRRDKLKKRPTFGHHDKDEAIRQYIEWQAKRHQKMTEVPKPEERLEVRRNPTKVDRFNRPLLSPYVIYEIPENEFIERMRQYIRRDPVKASQIIGFQIIPVDEKEGFNYSLKEIGERYWKKPRFSDPSLTIGQRNEVAEVKKYWQEFGSIVPVTKVGELQKQDILTYRETILARKKSHSTTWIKKRFEACKRIINNGIKECNQTKYLSQVRDWMVGLLTPPKKVIKFTPRIITGPDLTRILAVSNVEEMAWWLVSANLGAYGWDIASLKKEHLKDGYIVMRRSKTGGHRAAVMWMRTQKALVTFLSFLDLPDVDLGFARCGSTRKVWE